MRRLLILASGLGVALFLALGVWQVQRLGWKTALIADVTARVAAAPVAAGPEGAAEYTRLAVAGAYDGRQIKVKAVTDKGPGFWVMAPLTTEAGWTVWINRGFWPEGSEPPAPPGREALEGLLRQSQPGGGFLRANDPSGGRWFSRDVAAMSASLGIETVPWFLDATTGAPGGASGGPTPGLTVVSFRNHHLQYALTWFAMALLLAGAAWYNLRAPRHSGDKG